MIVKRGREYQTAFGRTENPISEGGRWVTGLATGGSWTDPQTSGGGGYGTMTVHAHPPYDDSVGLWIPPDNFEWNDMEIEAQVFIDETARASWTGNHEIELFLRGHGRNGFWSGYEILYSVNAGVTYTELVRWNGALNDFTSLTGGAVTNMTIGNGDWIKATIIGNTITQYHRAATASTYTQKNQLTDSTFTSGYAGWGHWLNGAGSNVDYKLTSWRARQLS